MIDPVGHPADDPVEVGRRRHLLPGLDRVASHTIVGGRRAERPSEPDAALPVSTAGSALLGTWEYMAPEQWVRSKTVDDRADVYSFGVLGFQLLTGRLPFIAGEQHGLMYCHVALPPPLAASPLHQSAP